MSRQYPISDSGMENSYPTTCHTSTPLGHTSTPLDHTSTPLVHMSTLLNHTSTPLGPTSTTLGHSSTPLVHSSTPLGHTSTQLAISIISFQYIAIIEEKFVPQCGNVKNLSAFLKKN